MTIPSPLRQYAFILKALEAPICFQNIKLLAPSPIIRQRQHPSTARSGDSKVKRLIEKLVGIEISLRYTRCWVETHTDILLGFSKLFYDILCCFDLFRPFTALSNQTRPKEEVDVRFF
jgi:hypothetical protein